MENESGADNNGDQRKKRGCFLSTMGIAAIAVGFIACVIAVYLIAYFNIPRKKCPLVDNGPLSSSQKLRICKEAVQEMDNKAEICAVDNAKDMDQSQIEAEPKEKPAPSPPLTGFRLNKTLIPSHYDLELWPHIYPGDDFGFDGNVTIWMTCREETYVIVLHLDMLDVHENTIKLRNQQGQSLQIKQTEKDVARQFYKIYLQDKLSSGKNYSLYMSFNGTTMHLDGYGFSRSNYMENGTKYWMLSTQFRTTFARRVFPVFDENYFRATFTVTLVRRNDHIALSNMPVETTQSRGGEFVADVFYKSVNMAPYLLAFSINKFDFVESFTKSGVRMRIYTQPSYIRYAEYAKNVSTKIIEYHEEWTGIPYPLPKLDQIVVPGFAYSAMENWGLVKYGERRLMYNPDFSHILHRYLVVQYIGHELAHMWFGNLVTCRWWDDIFLHEAFATYFAFLPSFEAAEPHWEREDSYERHIRNVMSYDGQHTSQPVKLQGLESHKELHNAFSLPMYLKGAAILRMVRAFLGDETFQKGLQRYLQRHKYKTVVDEDLYAAWQEQAEADGSVTWDTQKTNLSRILSTWVDQQNFPLLHVTDQGDGTIKVTQQHFVYEQDQNVSYPTPLGTEFLWDIPLTYTDTTGQVQSKWIYQHDKQKVLGGLQEMGWKITNMDRVGFYRTTYSMDDWNKIIQQLMDNHTVFAVVTRAGLMDDAFNAAKAGRFEEVDALRATPYLINETNYTPWSAAAETHLTHYMDMFYGTTVQQELEKYMISLVVPFYDYHGWTVETDPKVFIKRVARMLAIKLACSLNYEPCVMQAQQLYNQYMQSPSTNMIPPDLREVVYCTAVAHGGLREWEFLKAQYLFDYKEVFVAEEKIAVRHALACATKPSVIRRYLEYALKENDTGLFVALAEKVEARDVVWNFISEHWHHFVHENKTRIDRGRVLQAVTSLWNTEGDLQKLSDFVNSHKDDKLNQTYTGIEKQIRDNIEWMEKNMKPIHNFLVSINNDEPYTSPKPDQRRRRRWAERGTYSFQGVDERHDRGAHRGFREAGKWAYRG